MAKQNLKTKAKKEAKKQAKKHPFLVVLLIVLLVGGLVGGYFTAKHITRNDTFEIIGESVITLEIGENYEDEGAKAISFGQDISSKIKTETNLDTAEEGEYYIKYTVDDFRYGNVCRYRTIIVVEVGA